MQSLRNCDFSSYRLFFATSEQIPKLKIYAQPLVFSTHSASFFALMNIFSQDVISFPPYSSRIEFFVFVAIFLSLAAFTLISLDPLPFSIPSKYTREKDKEKKIEGKKIPLYISYKSL